MPVYRNGRHEHGQNFLTDPRHVSAIVSLVAATEGPIVEIGPGSGALTLPLQRLGRPVTAVDVDAKLTAELRKRVDASVTTVVTGDFLRHRLAPTPQVIAGNLPFHQTTAILRQDYIHDFVGPLGKPTETEGLKKVAVVGGGVGCAIAFPIAKKLHKMGVEVHSVVGFRNKDLVILEDDFKNNSDVFKLMTDDGSYGEKGLVTNALEELIKEGNQYDEVITIGPLIMMKFVCQLTKKYDVKTIVSMNPIMIDGTGMCGGCRLTVGGETKFACVDGPDFDGHLVDFDEAMKRGQMYKEFERHAYEESCNLLNKEVK